MSFDKEEEGVPKVVDEYTKIPEEVKDQFARLVSLYESEYSGTGAWEEDANTLNNIIRRMKGKPTLTVEEEAKKADDVHFYRARFDPEDYP